MSKQIHLHNSFFNRHRLKVKFLFVNDEFLFFLVPLDSVSFLTERCEDGVPLFYRIKDDEGKYFVRPPKTEHELQQEAEARKLKEDDDFPF